MSQSWQGLSLENSVRDVAGAGPSHGLERNMDGLLQGGGRRDVQGHDAAPAVLLEVA